MSSLADFEREYMVYNQISYSRIADTRRVLARILEFGGIDDPLDLDEDMLRGFLATEVGDGFAPTTVRKHRNIVVTFAKWAADTGRVDAATTDAMRRVPLPRGARGAQNPNPYSPEEIADLWSHVGAYPFAEPYWLKRWMKGTSPFKRVRGHAIRLQLEAIVAIALYAGLRREELWRLTTRQAHPINDYLGVSGARKNRQGWTHDRNVPWTTEHMKTAVARWYEFRCTLDCQHDQMWVTLTQREGDPMLRDTFNHQLQDVDGTMWSYKRLRHTAATELLRAGMPLEKVSRILGHSNVQQTLAYARIAGTDLHIAATNSKSRFSEALLPSWERAA